MTIQAIHTAINGRARYKIKELYRSPSLQKYLERSLPRQEGVIKASANFVMGSLLVKFKPDKIADEIVTLIE